MLAGATNRLELAGYTVYISGVGRRMQSCPVKLTAARIWDNTMAMTRKTTSAGNRKVTAKPAAVVTESTESTHTAAATKTSRAKARQPAAGGAKPAMKKAVKSTSRAKKAAPATSRRAVNKAAPAKAVPAKAVTRKKAATARAAVPAISPEQRQELIAKTAYYLAEKRGFEGGDPAVDWFEAEAQVDAILAQRAAPAVK
jgi:hypothetical protein